MKSENTFDWESIPDTMSGYNVDWDNLPICGTQGLVVSPNVCLEVQNIDINVPVSTVPLPSAGILFALGLSMLITRVKRNK